MVKFPEIAAEIESLKTKDPVFYRHYHNNSFRKTVGLDKAKENLDVLMDRTFMPAYEGGCHIGTA